jgi:hypothetical protein
MLQIEDLQVALVKQKQEFLKQWKQDDGALKKRRQELIGRIRDHVENAGQIELFSGEK